MRVKNMLLRSKKGEGVVTNVVLGIGALVIAVIITFVIISTLNDADLLATESETTIQVNNETPSWVNSTNYTLAVGNTSVSGYIIIRIWNLTSPVIVPVEYYQLDNRIVFTNGTNWVNATNITYTYVYTIKGTEQIATDSLIGNFTEGIDNVSKKIPVILLIVAVVFLFGALVLLVQQSKRMGVGGGSSL